MRAGRLTDLVLCLPCGFDQSQTSPCVAYTPLAQLCDIPCRRVQRDRAAAPTPWDQGPLDSFFCSFLLPLLPPVFPFLFSLAPSLCLSSFLSFLFPPFPASALRLFVLLLGSGSHSVSSRSLKAWQEAASCYTLSADPQGELPTAPLLRGLGTVQERLPIFCQLRALLRPQLQGRGFT